MLELIFLEGSRQGETVRLTFEKAWFGRQPTCDFVLDGEGIDNAHFSIVRRDGDYVLIDNKSPNGTFVNRVRAVESTLRPGDLIAAGAVTMQVREVAEAAAAVFRFVAVRKDAQSLPQIIDQSTVILGRKTFCQIQLNDPEVAPTHAELERRPDGVWIADRSSGAGVYVNGQRVLKQQLQDGDVVLIRPFEIRVALTGEKCVLEIWDHSREAQTGPKRVPGTYRDVVAAPPSKRPEAGAAKPSAAIAALPAWMQAKAPIWVPTSDILPNRFRLVMVLVFLLGGLGWVAYTWLTRSRALYSPGPTAKYHSVANASFSSRLAANGKASECAGCHVSFSHVSSAKCLHCHVDVYKAPDGTQLDNHFLVHQQRKIGCDICHGEHRGAQFDVARTVGESCQSAGCHVNVHRKQMLALAANERPTPAPKDFAAAFEVNWDFGGDNDVHPVHKKARVKCDRCHLMPAKEGDDMPKVPRQEMRMKCLNCHGFGPQATLRARCYSCHFEHPTKTPEKFSATRFPDAAAPAPPENLAGNRNSGAMIFLGALAGVPLLYFAGAAVSFRVEHRFFRSRTSAGMRATQPPLVLEPDTSPVPSGPASPAPEVTDNRTPGGNLRPLIDLDLCVGCGACVHVCPFNVLEIVNEKAIALRLGDCTEYSACIKECPTNAITLVKGGAMQTEELPVYDSNLETNVPGLYLAGEITGKGLIKIAINQGKRAVDSILRQRPQSGEQFDVIVIGAGPAGTSAALAARSAGLNVLVLEQGTVGNTIRSYPRQKFVMAEPVMIPVYGPLWMEDTEKEALLEKWQQIIQSTGLAINQEEKVLHVARDAGNFRVQSTKAEYRGARVVLAVGRRGSPRKLGVPGEDSAKVAYNLLDAEAYRGKAICVVGGGDSGIETANGLARADLENRVWLVHNGPDFNRAKPRNKKKILKAIEEGRLKPFFNAGVVEIGDRFVKVQAAAGVEQIDNDFVFVMVGGESPKKFLNECGIEFSHHAMG